MLLEKRLAILRSQGIEAQLSVPLSDEFFENVKDHWTFCAMLSDIYTVKEMHDPRREEKVAATLPP